MKKVVATFINSLGYKTNYSGKERIMYVTGANKRQFIDLAKQLKAKFSFDFLVAAN